MMGDNSSFSKELSSTSHVLKKTSLASRAGATGHRSEFASLKRERTDKRNELCQRFFDHVWSVLGAGQGLIETLIEVA